MLYYLLYYRNNVFYGTLLSSKKQKIVVVPQIIIKSNFISLKRDLDVFFINALCNSSVFQIGFELCVTVKRIKFLHRLWYEVSPKIIFRLHSPWLRFATIWKDCDLVHGVTLFISNSSRKQAMCICSPAPDSSHLVSLLFLAELRGGRLADTRLHGWNWLCRAVVIRCRGQHKRCVRPQCGATPFHPIEGATRAGRCRESPIHFSLPILPFCQMFLPLVHVSERARSTI